MKIEHISNSRHDIWQTCEQKYKYRYHLQIIPPVEPPYFAFGKIIHSIIENFTKNRGKIPIGQIAKDVLANKIEVQKGGIKLPLEYRNKVTPFLNNFMKLNKLIGFDGEIEWKFDLDLNPPNKKILMGVMDRVVLKNDKVFIIDYKTTKKGKFRKTKETIKADLQLQIYCRIAQRRYEVPADKIQAALYFLEDGQLVSTSYPQSALDAIEGKLLNAFTEIETKNPDHVTGRVGQHCFNCDYKNICPYFINKERYYKIPELP